MGVHHLIDGLLAVHALHALELHLLQRKYPSIRCVANAGDVGTSVVLVQKRRVTYIFGQP